MEPNFNYIEFAIEMSTQAKKVIPDDVKQEQDYITNTVYLAVIYAGERVSKNKEFSYNEKIFISQLLCEWAFHKTIDLLRAEIKKEYHKKIILNILEATFETTLVCTENNIKQKIILREVEKKVTEVYINSIEKLCIEKLIGEEQLKKAYNQSNIDKMVYENNTKSKRKIRYVKKYNQKKEKNTLNINTGNKDKVKKQQKSLLKYYARYYIATIAILAIAIYGTVYTYLELNNIEQPILPTILNVVTDPYFFIPAIIVIILHDIIQYIFIGFNEHENAYFNEIEEIDPSAKGLKNFINPKTIKQRFKTILFLTVMFLIAIFFFIKSLLKNGIAIITIIIYCFVSYKNSIPIVNFQDIISNKEFIVGLLVAIITQNFIKNKKMKIQTQHRKNNFSEVPDTPEVSYEELAEFIDEMGEEKPFDYKSFANEIAEKSSKIVPKDITENKKNRIIKRVIDYALLSGEALESDPDLFTTSQKVFIIQSVTEWTFNKSIDITRADIKEELHDEILQNTAFYAYEVAKQCFLKTIPQEKTKKAIEQRINKEFTKRLDELQKSKQISYDSYLKAQNESYIEGIRNKKM